MEQNRMKLEGLLIAEVSQQLLPGIPDEITIDLVATKLPWTSFHMLASVSRRWQHAIRSHQIYDARVRTQSTQTLVVMNYKRGNHVAALALYSLSDGTFHYLPPFPGVDHHGRFRGLLRSGSECVSLGSKVYVLGGCSSECNHRGNFVSSLVTADVYVLDIAGQRTWKQCASLQTPRTNFGCAVMNGKIYVVGGTTFRGCRPSTSEVYDPKSDAWTSIAPMEYNCGFLHNAITMGEELFVYDSLTANYVQFYNPLKNKWRQVEQQERPRPLSPIMVGRKLLNLTPHGTEVYDICATSWKRSQSFSFGVLGPAEDLSTLVLLAAVVVDDEFLALVLWRKLDGRYRNAGHGICLMRSKGLSSQNSEIIWQDTQPSLFSEEFTCQHFLRAIQL